MTRRDRGYFDDAPGRVPVLEHGPAGPATLEAAWRAFAQRFTGDPSSLALLRRTFFAGALAATRQTLDRQQRIVDEYCQELLEGEPPIGGPTHEKG